MPPVIHIKPMSVKMLFRSGIALALVLLAAANAGLWSTAYYAAWAQWQHMPADGPEHPTHPGLS